MWRFLTLLCLLAGIVTPARAQEWKLSLAPYLWGAGLEGTLETERVSADVDIPFSDIWDNLDAGVLIQLEARRGKLSVASNLVYLKLSPDAERPRSPLLPIASPGSFRVRAVMQQGIFELRPFFELAAFEPVAGTRFALDAGAGARVMWIDQHLHVALRPGVPVGPFSRRFDESADWVDFVAAARVRAQLGENLALTVSGDYGGFDLGSSSHRTWSLAGFFSYRLGEHWDLALGWRTLEFERGAVDLEMAGPLVGATYRF
jgi:hypothetical protein